MKKIILLMLALIAIVGCSSKPGTTLPANKINPEVLGSWSDDNGCVMSIDLIESRLILRQFNNNHGINYSNIPLQYSKQSVFTVFTSAESSVKFEGSFSDGFITINNNLCTKILRKDGTK